MTRRRDIASQRTNLPISQPTNFPMYQSTNFPPYQCSSRPLHAHVVPAVASRLWGAACLEEKRRAVAWPWRHPPISRFSPGLRRGTSTSSTGMHAGRRCRQRLKPSPGTAKRAEASCGACGVPSPGAVLLVTFAFQAAPFVLNGSGWSIDAVCHRTRPASRAAVRVAGGRWRVTK